MIDGQVIYKPVPGEDIAQTCHASVAIANKLGRSVAFRFNGVDIVVQPHETAVAVHERWDAESGRRAQEYRRSPEGQRAALESLVRQSEAQAATDRLIMEMPRRLVTLDSTVAFCAELATAADQIGIEWDKGAVADALEAAGYRRDAHVGKRPEVIRANRTAAAEWIIGQAIACLREGMGPHPMTVSFAEDAGFIPPSTKGV